MAQAQAQAMTMLLFCVGGNVHGGFPQQLAACLERQLLVSSQSTMDTTRVLRPTSEFHGNATPRTTPQGVDVGRGPLNLSAGSLERRLSATSVVNSLIFSLAMEIRTYRHRPQEVLFYY